MCRWNKQSEKGPGITTFTSITEAAGLNIHTVKRKKNIFEVFILHLAVAQSSAWTSSTWNSEKLDFFFSPPDRQHSSWFSTWFAYTHISCFPSMLRVFYFSFFFSNQHWKSSWTFLLLISSLHYWFLYFTPTSCKQPFLWQSHVLQRFVWTWASRERASVGEPHYNAVDNSRNDRSFFSCSYLCVWIQFATQPCPIAISHCLLVGIYSCCCL